jgi:hypothetical protein
MIKSSLIYGRNLSTAAQTLNVVESQYDECEARDLSGCLWRLGKRARLSLVHENDPSCEVTNTSRSSTMSSRSATYRQRDGNEPCEIAHR